MPPGKGGYHTIGLYLDTFTQHVWGFKFKTAGTGRTTVKSLEEIYSGFAPVEVFMSDGGKHFKNNEVHQCCEKWGSKHHVVAAYSPWVNGLVEGTNKILLYVLARLCAPEVGEDNRLDQPTKNMARSFRRSHPNPELAHTTGTQIFAQRTPPKPHRQYNTHPT